VLSRVSKNIGIVVSPPISRVALQHINFVKLTDNRILVILVSRSGIVQNASSLQRGSIANRAGPGGALHSGELQRSHLVRDQKPDSANDSEEQALLRQVHAACDHPEHANFHREDHELDAEIYLDGASNLIKAPEFSDINKMKLLFETIEQKSRLAALISRCIEGDTQEVRIGDRRRKCPAELKTVL